MEFSNNPLYISIILSSIFTGVYYLIQSNEDKKKFMKTNTENYIIFCGFSFIVIYLIITNCIGGPILLKDTKIPVLNGGNCCPF